jgi:RNase H-fold protein (predicted Holliday junction resolvase)
VTQAASCVLGIDPGRMKAGYAVVRLSGEAVVAGTEAVDGLLGVVAPLVARHAIRAVALGRGTNSETIARRLATLGLPVTLVDEFETSRRARELYFLEHPPRGWRRLVPAGLQTPPRPVDDYAAILIARRWVAEQGAGVEDPQTERSAQNVRYS